MKDSFRISKRKLRLSQSFQSSLVWLCANGIDSESLVYTIFNASSLPGKPHNFPNKQKDGPFVLRSGSRGLLLPGAIRHTYCTYMILKIMSTNVVLYRKMDDAERRYCIKASLKFGYKRILVPAHPRLCLKGLAKELPTLHNPLVSRNTTIFVTCSVSFHRRPTLF